MRLNDGDLAVAMITFFPRRPRGAQRKSTVRSVLFDSVSRSARFSRGRPLTGPRRCVLWILGMLLAASGCGTTHAILSFTAPSGAKAGTPFSVTVNVLYQGKPDTAINSRIHFTSSDPAAVLPPDYYFMPADAGSHTWTNGFTLATLGNQTISGSIADASGINGSTAIAVSP